MDTFSVREGRSEDPYRNEPEALNNNNKAMPPIRVILGVAMIPFAVIMIDRHGKVGFLIINSSQGMFQEWNQMGIEMISGEE